MNHPALVTKSTVRYVFSLFLVNAREAKGLTQEGLAELVHVSLRWIQLVEKGRRMPGFCLAVNLALVLELDFAALFQEILRQAGKGDAAHVPVSHR